SAISQVDAPSPTEVLDSMQLQEVNGSTIADALELSTGVLMKQYGAGASLKTASLRGSASEHVLILIDGNRYTGFQNGLVDLNLLPLDNVSRIEVLHGGASALYGADALGGVINIITRPANSDFHVDADGSAGSYDYRRYSTRLQGGVEGFGIAGGFSHERGQDNYPFILHRSNAADTGMVRTGADFSKEEMFINGNLAPDDQSAVSLSTQSILSSVGTPGPIFSPGDGIPARQDDRDINVMLGYRDQHVAGMQAELNSGFHYSLERYASPGYDTYYKNRYFNVDPSTQIALTSNDRLMIGGEFAYGVLESFDFGDEVLRRQYSMFISNEFVQDFGREVFDRLSLYQTLRFDDFSDAGSAWTPKLGLNFRVTRAGDVRFRASYGTSYRVPTFNDLYYPGFSNPALRPEHSRSFDVGLLAGGSLYGVHSAELTYFSINTTDRIQLDPATYIPVNIGKTVSQGIESSYNGRMFNGLLEIVLNYTYTDTRKKNSSLPGDSTYNRHLVFSPQNLFKGMLTVHFGPVTLSLWEVFTGLRYINDDNSKSLPAYWLGNATLAARTKMGEWRITVKGDISNLFDVNYLWFPGYPMPGRTFRVSIGVDY
ncbi:MAG TPA: TonB-dependent receptor, partial [Bacteroidota bacterium]